VASHAREGVVSCERAVPAKGWRSHPASVASGFEGISGRALGSCGATFAGRFAAFRGHGPLAQAQQRGSTGGAGGGVLRGGLGHNGFEGVAGLVDVAVFQGGMDQEHQAGVAQLPGVGQRRVRHQAGVLETLLQVHLRTGAGEARHVVLQHGGENTVPIPAGGQLRGLHEQVAFIAGVNAAAAVSAMMFWL